MNMWLTKLGVPMEIQALFGVSENLTFDYGDSYEEFAPGLSKIPVSGNIWRCGNEMASEIIISWSAVELMAMLTYKISRYRKLDDIYLLSLGCRLSAGQLSWIRRSQAKRKVAVVFPNDLAGKATDIRIAGALKNVDPRIVWNHQGIEITCRNRLLRFSQDQLSLAAFERAAGLRSCVRTIKPKFHNTFLEQLYDH